jgi:hypothetical protein
MLHSLPFLNECYFGCYCEAHLSITEQAARLCTRFNWTGSPQISSLKIRNLVNQNFSVSIAQTGQFTWLFGLKLFFKVSLYWKRLHEKFICLTLMLRAASVPVQLKKDMYVMGP